MAHLLLLLTVLQELPEVVDGRHGSSSSVGCGRFTKLHYLTACCKDRWTKRGGVNWAFFKI
jgi:hypothetical protein